MIIVILHQFRISSFTHLSRRRVKSTFHLLVTVHEHLSVSMLSCVCMLGFMLLRRQLPSPRQLREETSSSEVYDWVLKLLKCIPRVHFSSAECTHALHIATCLFFLILMGPPTYNINFHAHCCGRILCPNLRMQLRMPREDLYIYMLAGTWQRHLHMATAQTPTRWWTEETVAVVTGANKGVGLEIVRSLAREGVTVVLAARDEGRGLKATKELHNEGLKNVVFHQLDISKPASVSKFVEWIKQTYGGIDILVNNAGVFHADAMNYRDAVETVDTNYFGTKNLTEQLLPHLKPSPAGARIVNLSTSGAWTISVSDEELREKLNKLEFTDDSLDDLAKEYLEVCKSGDSAKAAGYGAPYSFSKVLGNVYTRLLAQRVAHRPHGSTVYVNCVHPGMVDTGMYAEFRSSVDDEQYAELQKVGVLEAQPRTAASGADTAVWLALHPAHGPSGKFWFDRKEFSYFHGWA